MKSHVAAAAAAAVAGSSLLAVNNTDRSVWRAPLAPSHMLNSSSFRCHCISSYLLQPLSTIIQPGSTIKFTVFHWKSPVEPLSALQRHICLNEAFRLILNLPDLFILTLSSGGLVAGLKSCSNFIFSSLNQKLPASKHILVGPLHIMWNLFLHKNTHKPLGACASNYFWNKINFLHGWNVDGCNFTHHSEYNNLNNVSGVDFKVRKVSWIISISVWDY